MRQELIYRLQNSKLKGHMGITQTLDEFRQRYHLPGFSEYIVDHIRNCSSCHQTTPASMPHQKPPLMPVASEQQLPEDMLQIDIVGRLPTCRGYQYILTAMDVFSKYVFAVPIKKIHSHTLADNLVRLFMQHSYIPKTIVTDLGTQFTSHLTTN